VILRELVVSGGIATPKKSSRPTTQRELLTPRSDRKGQRDDVSRDGVRVTDFVQIASLDLTEECLGKVHFSMNGVSKH